MFEVQLSNGRRVLDWRLRPGREGEKAVIGFVLAELEEESYDNYVTWEIALPQGGTEFHAFSGAYFQTEEAARDDFRDRVRRFL